MKPEVFWGVIRDNLFKGSISQGAVDTVNVIVDTFIGDGHTKPEHLAYILATAYHESYHRKLNPDWSPVREGFKTSNEASIKYVTEQLFNKRKISHNYALPHTNGNSYYGRGYVQITWPENYRKMGRRLDIPLYENPDLALDRLTAAKLLIIGMVGGLYTGRKLSDYGTINGSFDAYNARRIINGLDKAELIEGYYETFNLAIAGSINAV